MGADLDRAGRASELLLEEIRDALVKKQPGV